MLMSELVGKRFSELRRKCGLTQKVVAEYLGVDQSYISKLEKGERPFGADLLEKAAALFGCTVDYFVHETGEFTEIPVALRASSVTAEDLEAVAVMNRIAINLRFMERLLSQEG